MPPLRRKISRHMAESARSTARVGMAIEADAGGLTGYKIAHEFGKHYSYNVLLARLAACALKEFPYMNTRLDGDALLQMHDINIGIAMDTPNGLLVPVLKNADQKDLPSLQADFDALASRAISGMTRVEDLEGGTFTLTNLGSLEIESFLPVINTPECAILGIGAIIRKAVVEGDTVVIRPRVNLTLAFDHRIVDGAPAGKFLQRLKQLVELAQFS
jgi:pyruvate dehydrogenase E2 component (dihydrolipoamide acetyltransferase)